jgi:hypothetical protein
MIPFFLFLSTAVATGLLTMYWSGAAPAGTSFLGATHISVHTRSWAGAGTGQELGFAGAVVMVLAAYISAFSLWAGRYIAGLALVLTAVYCLCENIGVYPRLLNVEVVLALALLLASAAYVAGSFRVVALHPLYPRHTSPSGKWVVSAFIAVPSACFVWWAFWHEAAQVRTVTVPASWEAVALDRVTSGRRQMKFSFTAQDSSQSVTVASDELYDEIEAASKKSVDVLLHETFKHGIMVAWSVESIDGSRAFTTITSLPAPASSGAER